MGVAGCDPHRESFTIAVVDAAGVEVTTGSWPSTPSGFDDAAAMLRGHDIDRVGVEGSGSNGRHLAAALMVAGFDVREVPPRRSAQWRQADRRAKTDRLDAVSIARLTAADPDLGPAKVVLDEAFAELEVVHDRRNALIDHLKRALADADRVICQLPPELLATVSVKGRVRARLKALAAAGVRSDDRAVAARLAWLAELATQIAALDREARSIEKHMCELLAEHGSTLTDIVGVGPVMATEIVVRVGDPTRFGSEAAFARWNGSAPVALSSGEGDRAPTRHRLDLGGCRAVNRVLHIVSITQAGRDPQAIEFIARKRTEGKTAREARRAHKRRLSDVIIRHLWADHRAAATLQVATELLVPERLEPVAA